MTCEEHLIEAAVSLIDVKYHVEAAQVMGGAEGTHMPPAFVRLEIRNALSKVERVVNAWRHEIKESKIR